MAQAPRARVLFSTGSLYLYDTSYNFALTKAAGYDGIEIMCDERWTSRDPHYLKMLSDDHDLPILVVHTPFSPKIPGWGYPADDINRVERTLDLAERVGAESIVVHLPSRLTMKFTKFEGHDVRIPALDEEGRLKAWIETKLPDVQRKTTVKIAIENMPLKHVSGFDFDPTWWNEISTWSGVHTHLTLDTTHWATKQIDPVLAYEAAKDRIAHVHLSNFHNQEEHHLPQRGVLKLGKLLNTMAADHYAGTISLEVDPQHLQYKDAKEVRVKMRESLDFMREHLGQTEGS